MTDGFEELIKEIAAKHGIAVARDDPILVLQTINNRLLIDSAKAQEEQLAIFRDKMEELADIRVKEAIEITNKILNASLNASTDAIAKMMLTGEQTASEALNTAVDDALENVVLRIREIEHASVLNLVSSLFTLVAAGVALWGVLSV